MSITRDLEDQITSLMDSMQSERDPIVRLDVARNLERTFVKSIKKIKREAAYDARMKHSSREIADAVGADRKDIDYLVNVYLIDNPYKASPPRKHRVEVDSFVDLSRPVSS